MPTLADIDDLYKTTISKLPTADRLSYCRQRLDKLQYILEKNINILDRQQKDNLKTVILATQNEINKLDK